MNPSTLPIGITRLDALLDKESARMARALVGSLRQVSERLPDKLSRRRLADIADPEMMRALAFAFRLMLHDLTRPESRDWAVRVGVAEEFEALRLNGGWATADLGAIVRRWHDLRADPASLALALAEVCRG